MALVLAILAHPEAGATPEGDGSAMLHGERHFRQLFEASPDSVVLIDPYDSRVSWPIVDCNEVACRMNGYERRN